MSRAAHLTQVPIPAPTDTAAFAQVPSLCEAQFPPLRNEATTHLPHELICAKYSHSLRNQGCAPRVAVIKGHGVSRG